MNNLEASYNKILEVVNQIETESNFLSQIRQPKLSDKEVIALSLTAEYLCIDSEYQLFRMLPSSLKEKIERSVYNRRRRRLFAMTEDIRKRISAGITPLESYHLIDSMPLEVCKLSRSTRSRICKETYATAPSKGYCAAQKMYYYGYKLHAVCTLEGVIKSFDLTKAAVHDIHYLKDVKQQLSNTVLIGDKGYISAEIQLNLFETAKITLETPSRSNQKDYKAQPFIFRKVRKRIETLFSQLCDQFMIRRNYAKSFDGFKTRILAKITALTIIQLINKQLNRNINNIKVNIA